MGTYKDGDEIKCHKSKLAQNITLALINVDMLGMSRKVNF